MAVNEYQAEECGSIICESKGFGYYILSAAIRSEKVWTGALRSAIFFRERKKVRFCGKVGQMAVDRVAAFV